MRTRKNRRFTQEIVALAAVLAAASAAADVVYDAGAALRRNCNSGAYAGVDGSAYTDELGGQWKYLRASNASLASTSAFGQSYGSGSRAGMGGGRSTWTNLCSVLRFRPSEGGWYSGSVVVSDVMN